MVTMVCEWLVHHLIIDHSQTMNQPFTIRHKHHVMGPRSQTPEFTIHKLLTIIHHKCVNYYYHSLSPITYRNSPAHSPTINHHPSHHNHHHLCHHLTISSLAIIIPPRLSTIKLFFPCWLSTSTMVIPLMVTPLLSNTMVINSYGKTIILSIIIPLLVAHRCSTGYLVTLPGLPTVQQRSQLALLRRGAQLVVCTAGRVKVA